MTKTDEQWVETLRNASDFMDSELDWAERFPQQSTIVVSGLMAFIKELALDYYRQLHDTRKELEEQELDAIIALAEGFAQAIAANEARAKTKRKPKAKAKPKTKTQAKKPRGRK